MNSACYVLLARKQPHTFSLNATTSRLCGILLLSDGTCLVSTPLSAYRMPKVGY
ncbi:hypothetical protein PR202_ga02733 [Eleusine coracana subsp. coracana]|uniref:Uncharacterized protein n=1 Tax=Eleusine coracana subsp. coracana TaxID=191504 RepID=A0AAV5BMI7_ELECO|nr:hypothetical protein PR202_ga02733 [Eleusine coracana subsp. coracana]